MGGGHGAIDYINIYLNCYVDYVVDDCAEKQNRILPGCKKIVYSLEKLAENMRDNGEEVGVVLLCVYMENEEKVIQKCKNIFQNKNIKYISLYTPTQYDIH